MICCFSTLCGFDHGRSLKQKTHDNERPWCLNLCETGHIAWIWTNIDRTVILGGQLGWASHWEHLGIIALTCSDLDGHQSRQHNASKESRILGRGRRLKQGGQNWRPGSDTALRGKLWRRTSAGHSAKRQALVYPGALANKIGFAAEVDGRS